jgi:hypothetical protein|tara:strand:- start:1232 stop:1579 length:348 start_codon:yes stop_codon:yes gene_type:complete
MINFIKAVAIQNKINSTPILRYLSELIATDKLCSSVGICHHLRQDYHASTEEFGQFKNLCTTWVGYSGNIDYPIPSLEDGVSHGDYYLNAVNLWIHKQLDQRVSLINHVIKQWDT